MTDGYSIANMIIPAGSTWVRLTKPVVVKGHPGVLPGDVFEILNCDARELLNMEAAVQVEPPKPEVIETREPEVENRDPEPQSTPEKSSPRKTAKSAA